MYKSSNFLLHAGLTPMRLQVANGFSAQQPCIQNCHAFFGFSQFDGAVQVMIWPFGEFEQLWASLIDNFSRHKLSVAIRLFNLVIDRTLPHRTCRFVVSGRDYITLVAVLLMLLVFATRVFSQYHARFQITQPMSLKMTVSHCC